MDFFVGLSEPAHAKHFDRCFISVNRCRRRRRRFDVGAWIMDSGAFTEISTHGRYRHPVSVYAAEARRWSRNGNLLAVVAQDWMCEPFILNKTGFTVGQHQQFTIERYDALLAESPGAYVMPVLQGYQVAEYQRHIELYGDRLAPGAWVGVGSVCKRNSSPVDVANVLRGILDVRPDLRLHGFGVKLTSLRYPGVAAMLATADSIAWSLNAGKHGRSSGDWREAAAYAQKVAEIDSSVANHWQFSLNLL